MYKYECFEEYIQLNYFDLMNNALSEYIQENELVKTDGKHTKKYKFYEINDIKVFGIQFLKNKNDKVEFEVHLKANYTLFDNYFSSESILPCTLNCSGKFKLRMYGTFKDGFKPRFKEELEKLNEQEELERITSGLVPVISIGEMDQYATKFLQEFCPEALETPTKINVNKILGDKGIRVFYAPLEDHILGKTYFAKDKAKIYREDKGKYYLIDEETQEIDVEPGYILINFFKHLELPEGVYRNTMIHEAVHWFFHRNYFELRQLLDSEYTSTSCYRGETYYENDDIAWMEWQGRSMAPRILMPKRMALLKYDELLKDAKEEAKEREWDSFTLYKEVLKRFAKFFGVSKASAKIRLKELGKTALEGIDNYVDGSYIQPFKGKEGFLKRTQSYIISSSQLANLLKSNVFISQALQSEKLLYVNKMLVANNPKYVDSTTYKLTDYALSHVHECCVVFDVERLGIDKDGVISEDAFLFSCKSQRTEIKEPNLDSASGVIKLALENASNFEEHKVEIAALSLGATIDWHYTKAHRHNIVHSLEDFASKCDIDVKKIRRIRYNEELPTRTELLRMAFTLKLSAPYIEDLLRKGDYQMCLSNGENSILKSIMYGFPRVGLPIIFKELKKVNMEEILDVSDRWIERNLKFIGE